MSRTSIQVQFETQRPDSEEQPCLFNYGNHYLNGHLVIRKEINRMRAKRLELCVIMFFLARHKNVSVIFFHACRSAQLNMNRRMREPECMKSGIDVHALCRELALYIEQPSESKHKANGNFVFHSVQVIDLRGHSLIKVKGVRHKRFYLERTQNFIFDTLERR